MNTSGSSSPGIQSFPKILIPDEDLDVSIDEWVFSLIGRLDFVKLKFDLAESELKRQWKLKGDVQLIPLGKGFFIIKLDNEEDKNYIWGGNWMVEAQNLKLRVWEANFNPENQKSSSAFIWVHFPGLAIEYWKEKILLSIAQAFGRPVKVDDTTLRKKIGYYASVLVEVDLSSPIPSKVWIENKYGGFFQQVSIPKQPGFCNFCKVVGHLEEACRGKKKDVNQKSGIQASKIRVYRGKNKNKDKESDVPFDISSDNGKALTEHVAESIFENGETAAEKPNLAMQVPSLPPIIQNSFAVLEESSGGDEIAEKEEVATSKEKEAASSSSTFPSIPPGFEGCNKFHGLDEEEEVATSKLEEDLEITLKQSSSDSILASNRKVSLKSKATGLFPNGTLSTKKKRSTKSLDSGKISTNKLVDHGSLYGLSFPSSTKKCREMCSDVVKNHKHLSLEEIDESP